jgi:hypothetical protein
LRETNKGCILGFADGRFVPKQGGCLPPRRNVILTSYRWQLNGKLANMPINYMEYGGELWV